MDYVDSVTFDAWKKLLAAFFPTNLWIGLFDLIAWIIIPLIVVYFSIKFQRKKMEGVHDNVWQNCGKAWMNAGLVVLLVCFAMYLIYASVLPWSFSGLRSLEVQYREDVLGAKSSKTITENITDLATSFRNKKTKTPSAQAGSSLSSYSSNDSVDNISALNNTTAPKSSSKSKEYKVVKFFYKGYNWLHHLLYEVVWIVVLAFYFLLPGYKMSHEKIKI